MPAPNYFCSIGNIRYFVGYYASNEVHWSGWHSSIEEAVNSSFCTTDYNCSSFANFLEERNHDKQTTFEVLSLNNIKENYPEFFI